MGATASVSAAFLPFTFLFQLLLIDNPRNPSLLCIFLTGEQLDISTPCLFSDGELWRLAGRVRAVQAGGDPQYSSRDWFAPIRKQSGASARIAMMNHAAFILCTSFAIVPLRFWRLLWRKLDVVEAHRISAAVEVTPNHRELEGIVAGRRECHVAKIKLLENTISVSAVFVLRAPISRSASA